MAQICAVSHTMTVNRSGSSQPATGTIGAYIDYSISNQADKAVVTAKVVITASASRYGSAYIRIDPSTSSWQVNGVQTILPSGSATGFYENPGSTELGAASVTINKTHSTQNVSASGYYKIFGRISSTQGGQTESGYFAADNPATTISISAKTTYTISYNANGGSGAPSAQTKWYGETLTLSSTKPTRTGYTFLGWSTSSTATSATYAAGGNYTANSAATLYAVWKLNTYSVTYNARGGSPTPSAQTKTYGVNLTLSSTVPTLSLYTFKGWATSLANAQAGTVNYAKGATYTGNAALTLYAVWELTYSKPKITSVRVARCTQNGTLDDNGDYAKVIFSWSVFRSSSARYYGGSTTPYSANSVSNCTVTVGTHSTTVSLSGASGTDDYGIVGGVGSFEDDQSYKATVSITDSQTIYSSHTTTGSATLPPLFYPMDYNADASALGFFMPAPDSGDGIYSGKDIHFFVDENASTGWDALITEPLTVYGWTDALE